jgi:hypothetical protein
VQTLTQKLDSLLCKFNAPIGAAAAAAALWLMLRVQAAVDPVSILLKKVALHVK